MSNSLSDWTTFGIGGEALQISVARSIGALAELSAEGLVLGNGSNVLVSDDGYDGNVVINRYEELVRFGRLVEVGSGMALPRLCAFLAENGLSGLEWAAGIPGTVGGAVVMNAGAFGGQTSDRLVYADVLRGGMVVRLGKDELGFGYRTSGISGADTVLCAAFELFDDSPGAIADKCRAYNRIRREKQPAGRSAGSIFKNPCGASVGAVLDRAGLKGLKKGGAQISQKHANIIVNTGGASARDVVYLISIMKAVLVDNGIEAQEEIRYIGGF